MEEKYLAVLDNIDYLVSNKGSVKSLKRGGVKLKPFKDTNGYLRVALSKGGNLKQLSIHRLVATAFIGNPYNKPQVNHINGVKTDNNVKNLEWVTNRENCSKKITKKTKTSKYVGVSFDKTNNKWRASIQINGIIKNLGRFKTEAEAYKTYKNHLINHG